MSRLLLHHLPGQAAWPIHVTGPRVRVGPESLVGERIVSVEPQDLGDRVPWPDLGHASLRRGQASP